MEIQLTREQQVVNVIVNGAASHALPLTELFLTDKEKNAFEEKSDPQPYGARVYRALFPPDSLAAGALADKPDTLRLVMEDAALQRVPWEYLFDGKSFLALKMPLTRGLPANQQVSFNAEAHAEPNVLVVASDPLLYENGAPVVSLNVPRERDNVRAAFLNAHAAFHVTFVAPPTLDELQKGLARNGAPVILHFLGHGDATP